MTIQTHPGLSRLIPAESQRLDAKASESERAYNIVNVEFPLDINFTVQARPPQIVNVSGDTLHILEMQGADSIAVKLDDNQHFIPIHEGMTIRRRFDRLTFKPMGVFQEMILLPGDQRYTRFTGPYPSAVASLRVLTSFGECVTPAPFKEYGYRRGWMAGKVTCDIFGVDLLAAVATVHAYTDDSGRPLFGRFGGTVEILNEDPTATVYIHLGVPGFCVPAGSGWPGPDTAWPIGPGEQKSWRFESLISNLRKHSLATPGGLGGLGVGVPGPLDYDRLTLVGQTLAGTVDVRAMFSSAPVDGSDAESEVKLMPQDL